MAIERDEASAAHPSPRDVGPPFTGLPDQRSLERGGHPLDGLDPEAARRTISALRGLDPEAWTAAWGGLADEFAERAESGGVHITFTAEWQHKSRHASSYLMDLMNARARLFGGTTFEDYVARCPELSLLDQGLLDQPSAPLLLVNGRHDLQNSIDDIYLSLDHGDPKAAPGCSTAATWAKVPWCRRSARG